LEHRSGATNALIRESEQELGATLPEEYVEFVRLTNGAEGFVGGNAYVILWSVEELAPLNKAYDVQTYVPGLMIFGSDGGGEAYGFDTRTPDWPIIQVPFVGIAWSLARTIGRSFAAFLEHLYGTV